MKVDNLVLVWYCEGEVNKDNEDVPDALRASKCNALEDGEGCRHMQGLHAENVVKFV